MGTSQSRRCIPLGLEKPRLKSHAINGCCQPQQRGSNPCAVCYILSISVVNYICVLYPASSPLCSQAAALELLLFFFLLLAFGFSFVFFSQLFSSSLLSKNGYHLLHLPLPLQKLISGNPHARFVVFGKSFVSLLVFGLIWFK